MSDDFTPWFWREWAQTMGTNVADEKLLQLRKEWGGARVYIPKKESPAGKVPRLAGAIAAGRPLREAMEVAGFRKSQGYYWLGLRWRKT